MLFARATGVTQVNETVVAIKRKQRQGAFFVGKHEETLSGTAHFLGCSLHVGRHLQWWAQNNVECLPPTDVAVPSLCSDALCIDMHAWNSHPCLRRRRHSPQ